jgi:type IV pilus assembly protein PilE
MDKRMAPRRLAGFTLIELLVVVTIGAILFGIAIPAYQSQIRKSRRTDARTALLDLAAREERLFSTTNAYSSTPSAIGYGATPDQFPLVVGNGYYQVGVVSTAGPPPGFTLVATPVAGQGQDQDTDCASFSVDQTGNQSAANASNADNTAICWR